jgi:hypothetical protein
MVIWSCMALAAACSFPLETLPKSLLYPTSPMISKDNIIIQAVASLGVPTEFLNSLMSISTLALMRGWYVDSAVFNM